MTYRRTKSQKKLKTQKKIILTNPKNSSFAENVAQAMDVSKNYLQSTYESYNNIKDGIEGKKLNELTKDEQAILENKLAADAYERLLFMVGIGNLQIKGNEKDKEWKSASENGLPASFYVSGGGRIIFDTGKLSEEDKKYFEDNFPGKMQNQGGIAYQRLTSTHGLINKDNQIKEIKTRGIMDLLTRSKNHFGIDLNINNSDPKARDGEHGHMYIYKNDISMMIGVENSAPLQPGHSMRGHSEDISCFGNEKFRFLGPKQKIAGEKEYENCIIPDKYNSMKIEVTADMISALKVFKSHEFGSDIGSKIPSKDVKSFEKAKVHEKPALQPSKTLPEPQKVTLPWYSFFLNLLPFLQTAQYKESCKKYEEYKIQSKEYAIQKRVLDNEQIRVDSQDRITEENTRKNSVTPDLLEKVTKLTSEISTNESKSEYEKPVEVGKLKLEEFKKKNKNSVPGQKCL